MSSPLVIPAARDHLPQIIERWRELMATHLVLNPTLYTLRPEAAALYEAHVLKHIALRQSVALVAPNNSGGIDGYLLGGRGKRAAIFEVRQVGMIWDLAVRPSQRRQGIGRALTAAALRRFRAQGLRAIQVTYAPRNPSASQFWVDQQFETLLHEAYLLS